MSDWNVVVSLRGDCYKRARRLLEQFGTVNRTDYYNVLALKVGDVRGFLNALRQALEPDPALRTCLTRVIPATHVFTFQSVEEFEARAREAAARFAPELAGKSFYVRLHRRGFRGRLGSQREERQLADFLLAALTRAGTPGRITFTDPDVVVVVETIGPRAGMALVTRADLGQYPFVHPK
jgi:tRNA(Ser,Leu) C12 N-acetylase TAN1